MLGLLCDCECFCTNDVPRPPAPVLREGDRDIIDYLICSSCKAGYHTMVPGQPKRWLATTSQRELRLLLDVADRDETHPSGWRRFLRWLVRG